MLYDDIADPESTSPEQLREGYLGELGDVIEAEGVDAVAEAAELDRGTVAAIAEGDAGDVDLSTAAAVQATGDGAPAAEAILMEVRDGLLLGMTNAVLDVETVAAELDVDLDPKEIQQKIEGRAPMTLGEYATLRHFLACRANR